MRVCVLDMLLLPRLGALLKSAVSGIGHRVHTIKKLGLTARYSFIALISQAPFSAAAADAVN